MAESATQRHLIEEQHSTIELLQERLAEAEKRNRVQEESRLRGMEAERERLRQKENMLLEEIEQLRRDSKEKDVMLLELEEQAERSLIASKEQYAT